MNFNHFNKPCMLPPHKLESLVIDSFLGRGGEKLCHTESVRFEYICNEKSCHTYETNSHNEPV